MSLYISSLNSGSNGNCYYIGNDQEAVLIDAGISCRETERRLIRLGLSLQKIKAVFITHEHIDHVRGMEVIATKHQLPIYITALTLQNSRMKLPTHLVRPFSAYEPVQIGDLAVTAFPKLHDAIHAHSFVVAGNGVNIGVITDVGAACEHVIRNFRQCHAAFLEANYDEAMLENGGYPTHLKNRIRGGHGHLSNREAVELVAAHKPAFMSHLLLAHLSKNNNTHELVIEAFSRFATQMNVVIASRYNETEVYKVTGTPTPAVKPPRPKAAQKHATQATLF